jgi:hypothetical protein
LLNQTIVNAVRTMNTLSFWYDGERRTVEPHCYGVDGKGHDAVRAFQLGGKGWRLLHVSEMSGLTAGDQVFLARPDYRRNDKAMDRIYAQV